MSFLGDSYLIGNDAGMKIYAGIKSLPILDPHNHANVKEIAANCNYPNAWQLFAATDHYVWEVMRKCGVAEEYLTGSRPPEEKWLKMASVFPDVAGNPEQRAILLAAVERAYGPEPARGLSRLLDVFEAQQYRPPSNSATAVRTELRDASQTGGVQAAGRAVTRPLTTAGEALERWRAAGSTEDLARMLTSREGLARLRVLARVGETGLPNIVSGLLNMQRGRVAAQE
mgnify:CR=1 FL=1